MLLILTLQFNFVFAQCSLHGKVIDNKKEPLISAVIQVFQSGVLKGDCVSDYNGDFVVKSLSPGTYDIVVLSLGYDSVLMSGVNFLDKDVQHDFSLSLSWQYNKGCVFNNNKKPSGDNTRTILTHEDITICPVSSHYEFDEPGHSTLTREEISHMPR